MGGRSSNMQCSRGSVKPVLRRRVPNVSIVLANTQPLNARNWSRHADGNRSEFIEAPVPGVVATGKIRTAAVRSGGKSRQSCKRTRFVRRVKSEGTDAAKKQ